MSTRLGGVLFLLAPLLLIGPNILEVDGGTVITSIGYVFEAFTPYSMIRFFEFNDKDWKITEGCLRDMYNYLEGLKHGTVWAVKLYDATSYYGGGFFGSGANVRLSNPSLCHQLNRQYAVMPLGNILLANATMLPFRVQTIVAHYLLEMLSDPLPDTYKYRKVQQLICLPQSCTSPDLHVVLDAFLFQSNHIVRNNSYLGHRVISKKYSPLYDRNLRVLILLVSASILLYTVAYVLRNCLALSGRDEKPPSLQGQLTFRNGDICLVNGNGKGAINLLTDVPKIALPRIVHKRRFNVWQQLLQAISLENVMYTLLRDHDSEPQPLFMVIFTTFWIYSHLAAELRLMASNLNYESPPHAGIDWLSYAMDVYFFCRATSMAHEYFATTPREQFKVLPQLQHNFKMMLIKFLSLIPSNTFSLFAAQMLDKHLHHNVALEMPSHDHHNCDVNRFRHILYADTFLPLLERCMPWSWFISLEVQFFVVASLVLLIAVVHPRSALIIGASIFIISVVAAVVWQHHRLAVPANSLLADYEWRSFHLVDDNICLRISPYLIGLVWGYMLHKHNASIRLNIFVLLTGCLACFILMGFLGFGYDLVYEPAGLLQRALLVIAPHTIWSLMLAWIALSALTVDWAADTVNALLYPLERVTPICLLIGPIVIRLLVFAADTPPLYVNADAIMGQIILMAFGCLLVIYMLAFLLYILLEGPWQAILNTIKAN